MSGKHEQRPSDAPALATASSPGPLSRVTAALEHGAGTRVGLAAQTGLDPELVDTAIDHLIRLGRIELEQIGGGCPTDGCGSCPSGRADGSAGCGAAGPASARGPVALTLRPPGQPR